MGYEDKKEEGFGELASALETEWAQVSAQELEGTRAELQRLVEKNLFSQADADEVIKNREEKYAQMDSYGQAGEILNNFHMWLPVSGGYRTWIERQQDPEKRAENERLVREFDEVAAERGYDIAELATMDRQARIPTPFNIYLGLLERGWTRLQLTK